MGLFKNLFASKSDVDFLTLRCAFLDAELTRSELKVSLLEKALDAKDKAKDKFMLRYCDQISKQHKLSPEFSKEDKKPEPITHNYTDDEEQKFALAAQAMVADDIDKGIEPAPLEKYLDIIRENPGRYILS